MTSLSVTFYETTISLAKCIEVLVKDPSRALLQSFGALMLECWCKNKCCRCLLVFSAFRVYISAEQRISVQLYWCSQSPFWLLLANDIIMSRGFVRQSYIAQYFCAFIAPIRRRLTWVDMAKFKRRLDLCWTFYKWTTLDWAFDNPIDLSHLTMYFGFVLWESRSHSIGPVNFLRKWEFNMFLSSCIPKIYFFISLIRSFLSTSET